LTPWQRSADGVCEACSRHPTGACRLLERAQLRLVAGWRPERSVVRNASHRGRIGSMMGSVRRLGAATTLLHASTTLSHQCRTAAPANTLADAQTPRRPHRRAERGALRQHIDKHIENISETDARSAARGAPQETRALTNSIPVAGRARRSPLVANAGQGRFARNRPPCLGTPLRERPRADLQPPTFHAYRFQTMASLAERRVATRPLYFTPFAR
jgi:hypothetical protein